VNAVLHADWVRHDIGGTVASLRLSGTQARYRVMVSDAAEPEIGTYAATLAAEHARSVHDALDAAQAAGDGTIPAGPHSIRVGIAGHPGVEVAPGTGGAGGHLVAVLDSVAAACLPGRVATCTLRATLDAGAGSPAGTLEIAVTATGPQPVSLLMDVNATGVLAGDQWPHGPLAQRALWSAADVALVGFRGSDRTLLDGIHLPATIPAGDVARMYVLHVDRSGAVPAGALLVFGGVIHAPLEASDDPFPEDGFTLVAPITRVDAATGGPPSAPPVA
jgi:hypothetical protein